MLSTSKNCIYLSDNGCIEGLGNVDLLNSKQGNWIYRNSNSGRISVIGNYINNKKNGEWLEFYDEPYNKISTYILYENDSINSAIKYLSRNGDIIDNEYHKHEKVFKKNNYYTQEIEIDTTDYCNENKLLDALYQDEYSLFPFDDEWNHKTLGKNMELVFCYNKPLINITNGLDIYYSDIKLLPESDNIIYINKWTNFIKQINYIFLFLLLIVNILGFKITKYDK